MKSIEPGPPAFLWLVDITDEKKPVPFASFQVEGIGDGPQPDMTGCHQPVETITGAEIPVAWFANGLRMRLLDDHCPDTGCGIKVIRRDVFLDLPYFSGMHRYLPALVLAYGHEAVYAPVNDRPRRAGVSKYTNLGRGLIGIYDLIGVRWLIRRTVLPTAPALQIEPSNLTQHSSSEEHRCLQN